MTIEFLPGNKGPGDMKILWNGIQVKMDDIAEIVNQLCKNEDGLFSKLRCYDCRFTPEPCVTHRCRTYDGGQMLINLLQEVYDTGAVTDAILRKYKLGKYRPK